MTTPRCQCPDCDCAVTILDIDDGVCLLCRDGQHDPYPYEEFPSYDYLDDDE